MMGIIFGEEVLSTKEICRMLGLQISVAKLKSCGVSPLLETSNHKGVYWRKSDFKTICIAVSNNILSLSNN